MYAGFIHTYIYIYYVLNINDAFPLFSHVRTNNFWENVTLLKVLSSLKFVSIYTTISKNANTPIPHFACGYVPKKHDAN